MKRVFALLLAVAMMLSLVACGQKEPEQPEGPKVLKVGVATLPKNMDPGSGISNDKQMMNFNIFDTMLFRDNYGDGEMTSYICKSWEVIDDYSLKLTLKDGVTFHNGAPLTTEDVQFSIMRIANPDPDYISSTISTLFQNIESVEIVDDKTVIIHSATPDPVLLDSFATVMGCYMVPKALVE